jgi:conjugative relaxase-like TrwC/TraI family protein
MLTISKAKETSYYEKEEYYCKPGELPGQWYGKASTALGLTGQIEKSDYDNVMAGFAPSGESLVQNAGKSRVKAHDLCFSAPKPVSLILARADELLRQKIQQAHKESVRAALRHIEKHAAYTRRSKDGKIIEKLNGLAFAHFTHFSSRSNDMALHEHALYLNLAQRSDQTWGTIMSQPLYQWQKSAGAVYRSQLARKIRELGFEIERDGESFSIKGISQKLCKYYSKRANAIDEALNEFGASTSASKIGSIIKVATRAKKTTKDRETLLNQWQSEMDTLGFKQEQLKQCMTGQKLWTPKAINTQVILEELTQKKSLFREQDIYRVVAVESQFEGYELNEIEQIAKNILSSQKVVSLGVDRNNNKLFTTPEIIELESHMLKQADTLTQNTEHRLAHHELIQAMQQFEQTAGFKLSEEQKQSLFQAAFDNLAICQGSAGAGKSTSLNPLRMAYEAKGYNVIGACIARKAAQNLEDEAGIKSTTVAKILHEIDQGRQPLTSKMVLVLDEGGQIGTRDIDKILTAANDVGCKVMLSGDEKQLSALELPGVLNYLSNIHGISTSRIKTIRRQTTEWAREVVANFRDGDAEKALTTLNEQGLVHFAKDAETSHEMLIKKWQIYTRNNPDKDSMVLAQRWTDVKKLSDSMRAIYQAQGKVSKDSIQLPCVVSEKEFDFEFAIGDKVKFCKNDYKLGVMNGTLGTIKNIECFAKDNYVFTIETTDNKRVTFSNKQYCNEQDRLHLALGYASTVYSSQGMTINGDVFVYYTSQMDRANTYVACSRHKDRSHIFINDEEVELLTSENGLSEQQKFLAISQAMNQDNQQQLATELLNQKQPELEI